MLDPYPIVETTATPLRNSDGAEVCNGSSSDRVVLSSDQQAYNVLVDHYIYDPDQWTSELLDKRWVLFPEEMTSASQGLAVKTKQLACRLGLDKEEERELQQLQAGLSDQPESSTDRLASLYKTALDRQQFIRNVFSSGYSLVRKVRNSSVEMFKSAAEKNEALSSLPFSVLNAWYAQDNSPEVDRDDLTQYVDRLQEDFLRNNLTFNGASEQEVLPLVRLLAINTAIKTTEDDAVWNVDIRKILISEGVWISPKRYNRLERAFLEGIHWRLRDV